MFNNAKRFLLIFLSLCLFLGVQNSWAEKNKRKELSESARKSLIVALEAYESLHDAFFDYDAKEIEAKAQNLKKTMNKIHDQELNKLLTFSKSKLDEIKASNDKELNNQNYHIVSSALIYILNKFNVGEKYNAYSCPMVQKKWIQNTKKSTQVNNPYAPEMPHCGSQDTNY